MKRVLEKLRFRVGLVRTVDLTVLAALSNVSRALLTGRYRKLDFYPSGVTPIMPFSGKQKFQLMVYGYKTIDRKMTVFVAATINCT